MPDEGKLDHIEKLLHDQKSLEHRRQTLIADLLKQKENAMKEFDDKLAKLGYVAPENSKPKRSHHRKQQPDTTKAKDKTKE